MSKIFNGIALYDCTPNQCKLKEWFIYMEQWAEHIGVSWGAVGGTGSRKLLQFKTGKRKIEKANFTGFDSINLHGGVSELGTTANWQTMADYDIDSKILTLCFADSLISFTKDSLQPLIVDLLQFADFKYGMAYQRDYDKGPEWYPYGIIGRSSGVEIAEADRKSITCWNHKYNMHDGCYKTGFLRDIYAFNILVDIHLQQKVGEVSLAQWIKQDTRHGTLEKITDQHWLWSVDQDNIFNIQQALYPTVILLCYKPQ